MTQPTDILIPLGQGSRADNLELRYCLRSIEKHVSGVGNVWLVGEYPEWVQGVVHVPCRDNPNNWLRAYNIHKKIMMGIVHTDTTLSDDFLFVNDDHFLLKNYRASQFPYYHRGSINADDHVGNLPQWRQVTNTLGQLWGGYDFDIHCPILFNKRMFVTAFNTLPGRWPEYGYCIKSVYANLMVPSTGWEQMDDLKFREPLMAGTIHTVLEPRTWFSIGDRTLKLGGMRQVLEELYPTKSKWER